MGPDVAGETVTAAWAGPTDHSHHRQFPELTGWPRGHRAGLERDRRPAAVADRLREAAAGLTAARRARPVRGPRHQPRLTAAGAARARLHRLRPDPRRLRHLRPRAAGTAAAHLVHRARPARRE